MEGAARRALGALRRRRAQRRAARRPTLRPTGPFERTDNMLSGRAGLIWQPTDTPVVLRVVGQFLQPVRRARRLRRHGADQPERGRTRTLDPEKNRELRDRRAVGHVQGAAAPHGDLPQREDQRAHDRSDTGTTVLAGKRRVDGIELEADGADHAELGRLQRHRVHGRQDRRRGPANVQGKTPLASPEWSGNVWTVYGLGGGWEIGGGLRGQTGTWLTDHEPAGLADSRLRAASTRWSPTCRRSTRCGSTSTT